MDILERTSGFNNKEMWKQCEILRSIVFQTIETKAGRGKQIKITQTFKHNIPTKVRERIANSCTHYKKLYEKDMERNNQIKFRDYQYDIIRKGTEILTKSGFVYLAMEVRTGKTLTSLGIAEKIGSKNVLFLTKKKAISSIEGDYKLFNPPYELTVINYESIHKLPQSKWDLIICDEAHSMGAFAKPSNRAVQVKDLIAITKANVILLSGTPTPESYSQMYHQVYGIPNNPFREHKTFYKFCSKFVIVKTKIINGLSDSIGLL